MKKMLSLVALIVIIGAVWYFYTKMPPASTPAQATLNAALYPLYDGATWDTPLATTSPDYGQVVVVKSSPFSDVTNIAETTTPFASYYHDKLSADGWSQDMSREAGGPGGEISVYTKGDQFVVVMFQSLFKVKHADAPSECPCDVTFTLESGTQRGPTQAEVQATHVYRSASPVFSITLPTALATSTNDALWSVDPSYQYQAKGPGRAIAGVKFTIPSSMAAGTNLSKDTYVSVEHLPAGQSCDAATFLADPNAKSHTGKEGVLTYSVASSSDAAVGNRYEETVYARVGTNPCVAVRYYVHYAAIENFPPGAVTAFDKQTLLDIFDQVRRTLAIPQ